MADKLIINFDQYTKIVEKLAIEIHKSYKPTVLVGIRPAHSLEIPKLLFVDIFFPLKLKIFLL